MKQRSESELLHLAAAYCSAAERCISDVRKKIISLGGTPEVAEQIISYLLKETFIDESRFCQSFVNDKFRFNRWGRIRIGFELRKKGISSAIFAESIDSIDEEQYMETLSELLKSKKRTTKGRTEQEIFNKLYRFAAGRGFENDVIIKILKVLFKENYDADSME